MTASEPLDRLSAQLPDLLVEIAAPQFPDYTDEVLAATARTGQRPRWTFLERWLPMIIARQRLALPSVPWRPILAALAILALVAASLYVASTQRRLPAPFGPARNGALVYDRGGDLFVRDRIDAPERLILGGPTDDFTAAFTRDGGHLTFLRRTAGTEGSPDERIDAFIANVDGSNPVDLTGPLLAPNGADQSPDDSVLIFQAADPNATSVASDDLRSSLYRVDLRNPGGAPQRIDLAGLSAATNPRFRGPDGAEIVFRGFVRSGPTFRSGIFAARPDGSGVRALTPTDGDPGSDYQQPQLSPDGRMLTYTSSNDPAGRPQIHIRDLATGDDRVVTEAGFSEGYAAFSPDGTRIVYVHFADGFSRVMVAPVGLGSAPVEAGPAYVLVNGQGLNVSFSPDGRWVVVNDPASKETRIVDAVVGGDGDVMPWSAGGFAWQRLAP